jgi:hypothetical protein
MRLRRFLVACFVLFVVALAWNGLLHLVVLRGAEAAVRAVYRPNLADRMWLSVLAAVATVVVYVAGYVRFARSGSLREAIGYGLFFAAVAGVLVDLNQYVLLPIPGRLACLWFLAGVVEFTLYAVIVRRLVRAAAGAEG